MENARVILEPIQDVGARLSTYMVQTPDNITVPIYVRIWNNQIRNLKDGTGYAFQRPAAFIEVVNDAAFEPLQEGYRSVDLAFRIHIVHDYLNAEGTLEQDLKIFTHRDNIIALFAFYCPVGCGPMIAIREVQEYDHGNMVEYVIDFGCNFTDGTANRWKAEGISLGDGPANLDIEPQFS